MGNIQTEITRIVNAKAAIKTAIQNKGGTVNGKIDTFAAAINSLSTGGQTIEFLYYIPEDSNDNPDLIKDADGNLKCTYTVGGFTNDILTGLYYIYGYQKKQEKLLALISPNGISVLSKYMGVLYASESDIDKENETITFNGSLWSNY